MRLIDRHIGREIVSKSFTTAIWLLAVYLFIALLDLLEDIDLENQLTFAIQILGLSIPRMIYELAPMIYLIGTIMALATLARQLELTGMQAGGISKYRIAGSVVGFSLIFAVLMFVWGEVVVPASESKRAHIKDSQENVLSPKQKRSGVWIRDRNQFIYVDEIEQENETGRNLHLPLLGPWAFGQADSCRAWQYPGKLRGFWRCGTWKKNCSTEAGIEVRNSEKLTHQIKVNVSLIEVQRRDPSMLTVKELYKSIQFLKANGLKSDFFDLAFWNRFIIPMSMLVMAIFAILFTFRRHRSFRTGPACFHRAYIWANLFCGPTVSWLYCDAERLVASGWNDRCISTLFNFYGSGTDANLTKTKLICRNSSLVKHLPKFDIFC